MFDNLMKLAVVILLATTCFLLGQATSGSGCAGGCKCAEKWTKQDSLNEQYNRHIINSGGRIISPNPNIGASQK